MTFHCVRSRLAALLVVVWLGLGGWLGSLSGKLGEVANSGKNAYLPADAESVVAAKLAGEPESLPAVVAYRDVAAARRDAARIAAEGPIVADDGEAAYLVVRFPARTPTSSSTTSTGSRRWWRRRT